MEKILPFFPHFQWEKIYHFNVVQFVKTDKTTIVLEEYRSGSVGYRFFFYFGALPLLPRNGLFYYDCVHVLT